MLKIPPELKEIESGIYKYARLYNDICPSLDISDFFQIGIIAALKAKGKPNGLKILSAKRRMIDQVRRIHGRAERAKGKYDFVSIQKPKEEDADYTHEDFLVDESDNYAHNVDKQLLLDAVNNLPKNVRIVYKNMLDGIINRDTAKLLGVSESRISQLKIQGLKLLKEQLT